MAQLSNAVVADRCLSPAREAALARLLAELDARLAPRPLADLTAADLQGFLDAKRAAGYQPSTLRRQLKMLRAHYRRLAVADQNRWGAYFAIRSIELPPDTSRRGPHPYSADQTIGLWALLGERWPKLPPERDWYWVKRWRDGRSPYTRIRSHAIRCQLDAIIALALHCGLRKTEIFRLDERSMHPDNERLIVWKNGANWTDGYREVPYSDDARALIEPWMNVRHVIAPDHDRAWLNLYARTTAREPMTEDTFATLFTTYIGPGWSFRRLRDTCALRWVEERVEVLELVERLGLAVSSIDRYLALAPPSREEMVEAMSQYWREFPRPIDSA